VHHRCFLTPACVGGGEVEVGSFSSCPWSAFVASMGGYVLVRLEIGRVPCIFLCFCRC